MTYPSLATDAALRDLLDDMKKEYRALDRTLTRKRPDVSSVEELFARADKADRDNEELSVRLHPRLKCRAVFMSDFHLGTIASCAKSITQFLSHIEPEYLYLVGDIVDCWHIGGLDLFKIHKQGMAQTGVLQKLMKMERYGVRLVYIPGNHDEWFRDRLDTDLPSHGLAVQFEATHETKNGRRILIMHGDSFDEVVRANRWLAMLGANLYEKLVVLSTKIDKARAYSGINRVLKTLGFRETWSMAYALRQASDKATYAPSYEKAAMAYLFNKNMEILVWNKDHPNEKPIPLYDEIMCAHTHIPMRKENVPAPTKATIAANALRQSFSNTGCWVGDPEGERRQDTHPHGTTKPHPLCTAIIEDFEGKLSHIQWMPGIGIVPLEHQPDGSFLSPPTHKAIALNHALLKTSPHLAA